MKNQNPNWRYFIVAGAVIAALGIWPMLAGQIQTSLVAEVVALACVLTGLAIHFANCRRGKNDRPTHPTEASFKLSALLALLLGVQAGAHAQGTAFTYQGRLNFNGAPAAGNFDLRFTLFDSNSAGNQVSFVLTNTATPVTNGLFAVTLDFGAGIFTGPARWLEIAARTNGNGAFTTLTPRQQTTAAPYAIFSGSASNVLGSVPASQVSGVMSSTQLPANVITNTQTGVTLSGTFSGNGGGLTNLNASALATGTVPTNVLAGFQAPYFSFIGGGQFNSVNNLFAAVAGGYDNMASFASSVGGGYSNFANGNYATIPGGEYNMASGQFSFAAGQNAQALHQGAFVWADSQPGNFASPTNDTFNVRAYGGVNFVTRIAPVTINGLNVLTSGNLGNFWQTTGNAGTSPANGNFLGTTDNQPLELRANGARALRLEPGTNGTPNVIGGSSANFVAAGTVGAVIGGGGSTNYQGSIFVNKVSSDLSTVVGGAGNSVQTNAVTSVICGGIYNSLLSGAGGSFIGGGFFNVASAGYSFIGGGTGNNINANANDSGIVCGFDNVIDVYAASAAIGGGQYNRVQSANATIAGGWNNFINTSSANSVVAGGFSNSVSSAGCVIGGGANNYIDVFSSSSAVTGGQSNYLYGANCVIGGGLANNMFLANNSTIGGGSRNLITGCNYSTVPGGLLNSCGGDYAFAAGCQAQANHQSTFVWSDSSSGAFFTSTAPNQFLIRAQGGVGIGTNTPAAQLHVSSSGNASTPQLRIDQSASGDYARIRMTSGNIGGSWDIAVGGASPNTMNFYTAPLPGAAGTNVLILKPTGNATLWGTLAQGSDRAHKENIHAIDAQAVLAKVAEMPITKWNYITENGVQHLGPMAQDFYAAFRLGEDDKHITTVDEGGVALAAIQGLNQKLETENAELKARLEKLEQLLSSPAGHQH